MKKIETSAFDLAQRFSGIKEIAGASSNPQILAMLRLDESWPEGDEVSWCSAFMNYVSWLLRLPRSKNLMARSWLQIGSSISLDQAEVGFDVVVLKRNESDPGPEVTDYKGHVGFFAGREGDYLSVLGGNQSDTVNIARYPIARLLGVRRLV